jgi:hypothetical protein
MHAYIMQCIIFLKLLGKAIYQLSVLRKTVPENWATNTLS